MPVKVNRCVFKSLHEKRLEQNLTPACRKSTLARLHTTALCCQVPDLAGRWSSNLISCIAQLWALAVMGEQEGQRQDVLDAFVDAIEQVLSLEG